MTEQVIAYCLTHGREHADDETDEDYTDLVPYVEDAMITPCAEDLRTVVVGTVEVVNDEPLETAESTVNVHAGDLAYIDTVQGLVPCKVLAVDFSGADVLVTASRPGWDRGDVEHFVNPNMALVRRDQVKQRDGQPWIVR